MKSFYEILTKAKRGQAIGLLAIGICMFASSDLIESRARTPADVEFAHAVVIAVGVLGAILVFRRSGAGKHRE